VDVRAATCARAGLVGNPSDGYGGAVVAAPVRALTATIEVSDADRFQVVGPPGESSWPTVHALVDHAERYGHEGGQRLVTAAVVRLARWAGEIDDRPFAVRWNTTIPRSVGLAGSSALVVATMRALAARWALDLDPDRLALLALEAERDELGIGAGLQDRAVQAHDATVLVDVAGTEPHMRTLRSSAPVPLLVAWDPAAARPSGRYHAELRRRFDAGNEDVVGAMATLRDLAYEAAGAVARGDAELVSELVAETWRVRRSLGAVPEGQVALVEAAGSAGMAATSAGSGGSIAAVATEPNQVERFTEAAPTAFTAPAAAGDLSR
jgi:glucuronokinase